MNLHVLLVEDDVGDRNQLVRDLPGVFAEKGIEAKIDVKESFEDGMSAATDSTVRYDLVISDTYRGPVRDRDAAVVRMVEEYRGGKFCPLIIISNGDCPAELKSSAFVKWVSKVNPQDLSQAIFEMLDLGVPQLAKTLHDQIDASAGNYLWGFVEDNWPKLVDDARGDSNLLERLVRRRASLLISDLIPSQYAAIESKYGFEYYIYPALDHDYFSLGDILRKKDVQGEFRIVMTPHCYLFKQAGQDRPRADYVLTIRTVLAEDLIKSKLQNAVGDDEQTQHRKIKNWTNSPAKEVGKPSGRHWYLPKFLEIPNLFCDFFQLESVKYEDLVSDYDSLATLVPPYAEAMQSCFLSFYGSVGIPNIDPATATDMIQKFAPASAPAKKKAPRKKKASASEAKNTARKKAEKKAKKKAGKKKSSKKK